METPARLPQRNISWYQNG